MTMIKWTLIIAVLQSGDLLTTWLAGIEREANPLAVWAWGMYGFPSLIAIKMLTLCVYVAWWKALDSIYPMWAAKWRLAVTILVIVSLVAVCCWNTYLLIRR